MTEKVVETVVENAEPVVDAASKIPSAIKAGNPKVVAGTVVIGGGILVLGYFLRKKLRDRYCVPDEAPEVANEADEESEV